MNIVLDPNPCPYAWGPGCDSYNGGHGCDRDGGHVGRHRCVCGATSTDSGAEFSGGGT